MDIPKKDFILLYKMMKKIRFFELFIIKLAKKSEVFGSIHLSIGQEAIAAGVCYCLEKKDYIYSTHRCFSHYIAKGGNLKKMLAEIMGKETGTCKGKGGSMHLFDIEVGMLGTSAIVGGGVPIATGIAYACKNFNLDRIVVSFFGDGALNTGSLHESLNLASLWKLPVIFVCENNQYAISLNIKKSTSVQNHDYSKRACSYDIDGYKIDGNNIIDVIETTKKSIRNIKKNNKPSLIICDTYRWKGHTYYDPAIYRSKNEEEKWKKRCPILNFEKKLIERNILNKDLIDEIEYEINLVIDEAYKYAKSSKKPELNSIFEDIYT